MDVLFDVVTKICRPATFLALKSLTALTLAVAVSACGSGGSSGDDNGSSVLIDDNAAPVVDAGVTPGVEETLPPGTPLMDDVVEPAVTMASVEFRITVPAYTSDELQLDVSWGNTDLSAAWVVDETWVTTGEFPVDAEDVLTVTFYDNFGSTTLATHESNFRVGTEASQVHTVSADEFDDARWDNDGDGVSNLAELLAGTDPDFVEVAGAPDAPSEVISIQYSGYDLELFWPRATDPDGVVVGYDVYRDDEEQASRLDALSYYDGSVQPETEYTYDVYAIDNLGNRSRAATLVVTTPVDEPVNGAEPNYATLTGGETALWFVSDGLTTSNGGPTGGGCSYNGGAGSGVGITDARLERNGDAYDWASMLWVNGERVGGWLRSASDSTTNFASVPLAGLEVSTEYHAVSTQAVLRNYTSFANNAQEDIFIVVNIANNFGSDSRTQVMQSSSGDLSFGTDDRWVITDDSSTTGGDPANTTVFYGPDAPASVSVFTGNTVFNCAGPQGLTARIDVLIPAGERRALMFFHGMSVTSADAMNRAVQYDTTPAFGNPLVEGLSQAQLSEVANWRY